MSENSQLPHTDDDDLLPSERGANVDGCQIAYLYRTPAVNSMVVGRHIGLLNRIIVERITQLNNPVAPYSTFCVGHSLGAHVCGFMGKTTNEYLPQDQRLTRIIAMDPAGKTFSGTKYISTARSALGIFSVQLLRAGEFVYIWLLPPDG